MGTPAVSVSDLVVRLRARADDEKKFTQGGGCEQLLTEAADVLTDGEKYGMPSWCPACFAEVTPAERALLLDPAGEPKVECTLLEREAIAALNSIKAWLDGADYVFPEEASMRMEAVLMMASVRRKGIQ